MGSMNGFCSVMIFLVIVDVFLTLSPVAAKVDLSCGKSLSQKCGDTIAKRVVFNRGPPPTDDCCLELVKIGKPCHDLYTVNHIQERKFEGRTLPVLKRSENLWSQCVAVASFVFPSAEAPKSRN